MRAIEDLIFGIINFAFFMSVKCLLLEKLQISILSVHSHSNIQRQGFQAHAVADDLQIYGSTTQKVLLI